MAELFQKDRTDIERHIHNIFKEKELDESLVCGKFARTKDDGRRQGLSKTYVINIQPVAIRVHQSFLRIHKKKKL